ncbi:hypothetical protein TRFO_12977 [Tritrichomonas foetus]|uniref:Uncharacterized protein n=1 Tax=Tritrichomonas foetus TaxID=1144522 RepID=A0A1J4L438_9EUKA|nr:hypothetical protein TRFO_12977 [Tritrichomonas foetus]|eukprot:OHT16718.1 hypothetical protein TRFO_12977 [Tritrichomonas foetus]
MLPIWAHNLKDTTKKKIKLIINGQEISVSQSIAENVSPFIKFQLSRFKNENGIPMIIPHFFDYQLVQNVFSETPVTFTPSNALGLLLLSKSFQILSLENQSIQYLSGCLSNSTGLVNSNSGDSIMDQPPNASIRTKSGTNRQYSNNSSNIVFPLDDITNETSNTKINGNLSVIEETLYSQIQIEKYLLNINKNNFDQTVQNILDLSHQASHLAICRTFISVFVARPKNVELNLQLFTSINDRDPEFFRSLKIVLFAQFNEMTDNNWTKDTFYEVCFLIHYIMKNGGKNENFFLSIPPVKLYHFQNDYDHFCIIQDITKLDAIQSQNYWLKRYLINDDFDRFSNAMKNPIMKNNYKYKIPASPNETISFLHYDLELVCIAAFFGSIKCFRYILLKIGRDIPDGLANYAVSGGNIEIVKLCESSRCDFSQSFKYAIEFNHSEIIEWLIEEKQEILGIKDEDITKFVFRFRNLQMIDSLIRNRSITDNFLVSALKYYNITSAKWFIEQNFVNEKKSLNYLDEYNCTPLFYACQYGLAKTLKLLLEQKLINPNKKCNDFSPFQYCLIRNKKDLAKIFLDKKLNLKLALHENIKDEDLTPFIYCVDNGQLDIAKLILSFQKVDHQTKNQAEQILPKFSKNNETKKVKMILKLKGIDYDCNNKSGETPFFYAVQNKNVKIAKMLLRYANGIEKKNKSNRTYDIAIKSINEDMLANLEPPIIIDKLADVYFLIEMFRSNDMDLIMKTINEKRIDYHKCISIHRENPLHIACLNRNLPLVKKLLTLSPDLINITDDEGDTPLHMAISVGSFEIAKLLIDSKANVYITDNSGNYPIHTAARCGQNQIFEYLLKNDPQLGYLINQKNGYTPLHYACMCNNYAMVNILKATPVVDIHILDHKGFEAYRYTSRKKIVRLLTNNPSGTKC